ncbi:ABC transporter permease [Planomicrobium sp. YIM 101495]|uniref:lmo0954 family membrane protein n=1 Tax=Planomicrobium sp. YIM 101495 TaxID=2665160 RepID=UPI0012B94C4B|nr:ABC transporter permease [Planomicrobium sp. YIM 101495]MTD30940.1 ABC transporter permease [Planomicrobium sp. YIM 101495]
MNKFWMVTLGIIAGFIAISSLPSLISLAITALVIYASFHFYTRTDSTFLKVVWAIVGIGGAISAVSNIPALFGLAAVYLLWIIYRDWNKDSSKKVDLVKKTDDPFANFENEWDSITK